MSDMSHQESVKPGDSASQTGKSSTSSTSRARVKAMVKRAALAAQAAALNEQQALELEEFKLKQRRSKLELQTRLSMAKAEEDVFSQHGESMTAAVDKDVSQQRGALTTEPSVAIDLEKAVYQLRQPPQVQPNRVSTTDKDFSQRGESMTAAADKDVSQRRGALTTEPSMATDLEKGVYQLRQPSELQPNMVSATVTDKDFTQHGEPLKYDTTTNQSETTEQNGSILTGSESSYGIAIGAGMRCVLPIGPVHVQAADGDRCVRTYALLDSGSTTFFCTEGLVRKVSAQGEERILSISTLDNPDGRIQTQVVSCMVDTGLMTDTVKLQKVFTNRKTDICSNHMASMRDLEGWQHLGGLDLPFACGQEVGLLIGQDTPFALMPLEVRRGKGEDELFAIRTVLGWSLHGPAAAAIPDNKGMSVKDRKALDIQNEGKCKEMEQYQFHIPFKEKRPTCSLTDNRWVAEQRLRSLRRKLGRDHALHYKYTEGYAEVVEEQDCQPGDVTCRYLPHHSGLRFGTGGRRAATPQCLAFGKSPSDMARRERLRSTV
ncbi:uncharacterized protein LOC115918237 [Strongylocentrotus purpuratus]|uniref:Peptidase aspartic putative domain-containing protein n=1 Tax=Strongylocentrotus purpuratus TaxID=7668 RepID=A0A7M7NVF2_STRPU|nr:uncharacterized protein LOC115918237 [Strongylocentrotus purpuratus]